MDNSNFETTAILPDLGIKSDEIPAPKYEEVRSSETAYNLLLNLIKNRDKDYISIKNENKKLKQKVEERKSAVVFMSIAEILLSLGISILFSLSICVGIILISLGVILTGLSIYYNFK